MLYESMLRRFSAALGESVGSYINKRRLYEASKRLVDTKQKVIEIALDCGFESSEAFSRAFKVLFEQSPTTYRKQNLHFVMKSSNFLIASFYCKHTNVRFFHKAPLSFV